MIIRISTEAQSKIRRVYENYPANTSERDKQLIEDILYHLSSSRDINIGYADNHLVIVPRGLF